VVWIRTLQTDSATRHQIAAYVEGDAAADKATIFSILHEGKLSANGNVSRRPLNDFPLYKRAQAARQAPPEPAAGKGLAALEAPRPAAARGPGDATTRPAAASQPASAPAETPREVQPLNFRADHVTSETVDGKRITIARGNVYVSQGSADSALFLELRSQAAVLFTEDLKQPKTTPSPISPRLGATGKETVTGVYLEGDVVMARGERYLRGERAYYDFLTDRAYIPNVVLRTIQEQRNIPIYIRAQEVRVLSAREMYFYKARVTSSDLYSPTYHIGARKAYLMDTTPYDAKGQAVGPRAWLGTLKDVTFNIRSVPVAYSPIWKGNFEEGHSALRTVRTGSHGNLGFGVETDWHLFRLLGLVPPKGVKAIYELNWYEEGVLTGVRFSYARQTELRRYTGYGRIFGLFGGGKDDDFGDQRQDIKAPSTRGRMMWRHKEFLPQDWEAQFELSYLSDRNFLERYFPTEFYAGKEQETLIYAKKQRDNWAFTALAKYRLNRFETQDEAAPDLGFFLTGEPLMDDTLTLFSESHAGLRKYKPDNDSTLEASNFMGRLDTREEVDFPIRVGPATVVPYAVGRLTYWSDEPANGENARPYAQVGARASTNIWRVYQNVIDRLWDLNGLRHVITPELAVFLSDTGGVSPEKLFPLDADIEQHLRRVNGASAGIYQRLQTKRGQPGNQHVVDWMRLDVVASVFDNGPDGAPGDGRFYLYRPEYSLGRNHVNADYSWYLSDSTTFLADMNYDTDSGSIQRASAGLSLVRDPRLAYYVGWRMLPKMDSSVGTFGAKYQINRKYSVSLFEQYDFDFHSGRNMSTNLGIVRKLERWYCAVTLTFDQSDEKNNFGVMFTLWPEGIPEVRIGRSSRSPLLTKSGLN
jgi:hypothetical protein